MLSIMNVAEVRGWLATASVGEAVTYFRGCLVLAEEEGDRSLGEADRRELIRVANYLWKAAQHGRVHLVQRRNGPDDFSYLAIAAGKPVALPPHPH